MAKRVEEYLEILEPWVSAWALTTQAERERKRRGSTPEELKAFYDAMVPLMEGIIDALNDYSLDALPPPARRLVDLTLSLAEVAPHVEFYGCSPRVPFAFAEERFVAARAGETRL